MNPDIPFPSVRKNPLIEVFYLKDHPPIICGAHGHIGGEMMDDIERDLADNPEFMDKGQGTYLYEATWISAQVGDEGRIELPSYWDLDLVRFQSVDEL